MAKKPPKAPTPPPDDFDPERDLNEEIAPLDDELVIDDDIVEPDEEVVVADEELVDIDGGLDEGAGTTQLVMNPDDVVMPDIEVDADEVVVEDVEEDVAAELDETVAEAPADDNPFSMDEPTVAGDDDDLSPHDAETLASMPALDEDDASPFSGVGGDDDEAAEVGEDGELVAAGVADDIDDPTAPYYEEEIPKPRTHWFTWTLIGLNVVAALVAPYMIVLAFQKRQEFTYANFRLDLAMLGLPTEEEERAMTASRATLPGYRISSDEIKKVVTNRIGGIGDRIEGFEGQIVTRIPPSMLTKELLKDHFGEHLEPAGEPITTVEGEVRRVLKTVIPDIQKAADDSLSALNNDQAKRDRARRLLQPLRSRELSPLALDIDQKDDLLKKVRESKTDAEVLKALAAVYPLDAIDGKIKAGDFGKEIAERFKDFKEADHGKEMVALFKEIAQADELERKFKNATGKELDDFSREAAERRMAFDFLLPLELFRPSEIKGLFVEKLGDIDALPLPKVLERVTQRIQSTIDENYTPAIHFGDEFDKLKRDTIEKRLTVAFTLLSLAQLKKPDGELLYPKLMDRIPLVVGQYDFALACELFPSRLLAVNDKVLQRIKIDREGFQVPDPNGGALVRGKAFIDYYEDELQRIRFLQLEIFKSKIRLDDLKQQKDRYEKLLAERTEQREDVLKKIAVARAKTEKAMAELRVFQNELFRNQLELATSEEDIDRLHQAIEVKMGKKGAKTP